jgi:hypothetical protein
VTTARIPRAARCASRGAFRGRRWSAQRSGSRPSTRAPRGNCRREGALARGARSPARWAARCSASFSMKSPAFLPAET